MTIRVKYMIINCKTVLLGFLSLLYSISSTASQWVLNSEELDSVFSHEMIIDAPSTSTDNNKFGSAVSLDGTMLAVSDPRSDIAGEVYLYQLSNRSQKIIKRITPSDGQISDAFGHNVEMNKGTIAVASSCFLENSGGCVYVYQPQPDGTYKEQKIQVTHHAFHNSFSFGEALALEGSTLVIGSSGKLADGKEYGMVFVYTKNAHGQYELTEELSPAAPQALSRFGSSVSIDNGIIAVGAPGYNDNHSTGQVFYFKKDEQGNYQESSHKTRASSSTLGASTRIINNNILSSFTSAELDDMFTLYSTIDKSFSIVKTAFVDDVHRTITNTGWLNIANNKSVITLSQGSSNSFPPHYQCNNLGCLDLYLHQFELNNGIKKSERRFRFGGNSRVMASNLSSLGFYDNNAISVNNQFVALGCTDCYTTDDTGYPLEGEKRRSGKVYLMGLDTALTNNEYISVNSDENMPITSFAKLSSPSENIQMTGEDAELFAITSSGTLSLKSLPNFESPADSNADNIYKVTLSLDQSKVINVEYRINNIPDSDLDGIEDNIDRDDDNDGVPDTIEEQQGSDPKDIRSYLDSDGDLVPDHFEDGTFGHDVNVPDALDSDMDGVSDYIEYYSGENDAPLWRIKTNNSLGLSSTVYTQYGDHHRITEQDFGQVNSITVDNDFLFVGDRANHTVFVYKTSDSGAVFYTALQPFDKELSVDNRFGWSLDADNNTLVVGAPSDGELGKSAGAIYVFQWNEYGAFTQKKITPNSLKAEDGFGKSVAIDNNSIVVGAENCSPNGVRTGCAWVLKRQINGSYTETLLTPKAGSEWMMFGSDVAIEDNTIVITAPGDDLIVEDGGSAYIFDYQSDGTYNQQKIHSINPQYRDDFGQSVAIYNETIAISQLDESSYVGGSTIGTVYLFEKDQHGLYKQTNQLTEGAERSNLRFGSEVKFYDGDLYVGFAQNDRELHNVKSLYRFTQDANGNWNKQTISTEHESFLRIENSNVRDYAVGSRGIFFAAEDYFYVETDSGNSYSGQTSDSITQFIPQQDLEKVKSLEAKAQEGIDTLNLLKPFDLDGDELSITISGADNEHFSWLNGNLTFAFTPLVDSPLDYGRDNTYNITLTASDKYSSTSIDLIIQIVRQHDMDGDGIHDNSDVDDDGDGVKDTDDAFPRDPLESLDSDNDGIGNNQDTDDDNDGIEDHQDSHPLNPTEQYDTDKDGIGNNQDDDDDNDGLTDEEELLVGTDPFKFDTDSDGFNDQQEIDAGTDPLDNNSYLKEPRATPVSLKDRSHSGIRDIGAFGLQNHDNSPVIKTFDPVTGSESGQITWPADWNENRLHLIADRNEDSIPELALFGTRKDTGRIQLTIKSGDSGVGMGSWSWPSQWQDPIFIELQDMTGDNINEFAIFGRYKANNVPQLVVKDGVNKSELGRYPFPIAWKNLQPIKMGDYSGDGISDVAIYGEHPRNSKSFLFIRSGANPAEKLDQYNWPNKWEQKSIHSLPDMNNDDLNEIGLFGTNKNDGRHQLHIKKGHTKKGVLAIYNWPSSISTPSFYILDDQNQDDQKEFAVLGYDTNKQRMHLMVKSGSDRTQTLANYFWPGEWFKAVIQEVPDMDGDNLSEIVLVGEIANGAYLAQIKSRATRGLIANYQWGQGVQQRQLIQMDDIDNDGISDIGLFGVESETGLARLDIYSTGGDQPLIRTIRWSTSLH